MTAAMTQGTPVETDHPGADRARPTHGRRRPAWLLGLGAGGVFAAGLVAGGVAVTATGVAAQTQVEVVPSPSPSPVYTGAGNGGRVSLDSSCVHAINQVQTAYGELSKLGGAASNLDFTALDRAVRHLQDMAPGLKQNIGRCRATVRLPSTGSGTSSPAPSGSPTPSG